jgi:hypothetical protein
MNKPWLAKLLLKPDFMPNIHDIVMYSVDGVTSYALVISKPIEVDINTYDVAAVVASSTTRPTTCTILLGEGEFTVDVSTLTQP